MHGSDLDEKSCFKMLGMFLLSKLNWGSFTVAIAEIASKKTGAIVKFRFSEVALYLCD